MRLEYIQVLWLVCLVPVFLVTSCEGTILLHAALNNKQRHIALAYTCEPIHLYRDRCVRCAQS